MKKLLLCPLLAVLLSPIAAHSAVPVWKIRKHSTFQGDATVYVSKTMSRVTSEKSPAYSLFRAEDKKFFTTINPKTKTYHREDFETVGKTASLITTLGKFAKGEKKWEKLNSKRQICGKQLEGYRNSSLNGEVRSEAWYFTECPIQQSTFLTKIFDVPDKHLELAEVTLFQNGHSTNALKTLSVEVSTVPEDFFAIPKNFKYSQDRFGVVDGAMDDIQGFAEDFLNDPDTGSKSGGKTKK